MNSEHLTLQKKEYTLHYPAVMGILNVTPDSFSDGGTHMEPTRAIETAHRMVSQGAQIIDIGAESTRPGSDPISIDEELKRLLPVVEPLLHAGVCLSIDTNKPEVQRKMIDLGVPIINDIMGGSTELFQHAADKQAALILMHTPAPPKTMQQHAQYHNVLATIQTYFTEKAKQWETLPIPKIWLDPGVGFGKELEDNLRIMAKIDHIGLPDTGLLLGSSRKSWINQLCNAPVEQRLGASLASALFAMERGTQIIRVHDVADTFQAIKTWQALKAVK